MIVNCDLVWLEEGSTCGLFEVLSLNLLGMTEEN
jgi:hypothetical protein